MAKAKNDQPELPGADIEKVELPSTPEALQAELAKLREQAAEASLLREENERLQAELAKSQPVSFGGHPVGQKYKVSVKDGPTAVVIPAPGEHCVEAFKRVTGMISSIHAPTFSETDEPLGVQHIRN